MVFIFQIVWVQAIYYTTPTTAVLLSKLDIVFIAILSFFLLKSERRIITSKYFLLGSTLALIGVVGVVLGRNMEIRTEFNLGVALLLIRSLLWAIYTISIRKLVAKVDPLIAATWVFIFASLLFLPTILLFGDIHRIAEVPLSTNLLLFGSGFLCVGMGNAANYTAVKHLGANIPTSLLLITPFLTGIFSYIILGEVLTATQIVSGLLIIFSCWLIIRKVVTGTAPAE